MDRHITTHEMFADAAKRPEEIPQTRPHAFGRIGMNFKDVILIVIACPFLGTMGNGGVLALDALVRLVLVGEDMAVRPSKAMHMSHQGLGLRGVNHSQPNLPARTPNGTQHGRTVVSIGASTAPLVGAPTGRPVGTDALLTFFPPHFGRVRRSRLPNRGPAFQVVSVRRSAGSHAATSKRSGSSVPTPQPIRLWSHLSGCRVTARPPVAA